MAEAAALESTSAAPSVNKPEEEPEIPHLPNEIIDNIIKCSVVQAWSSAARSGRYKAYERYYVLPISKLCRVSKGCLTQVAKTHQELSQYVLGEIDEESRAEKAHEHVEKCYAEMAAMEDTYCDTERTFQQNQWQMRDEYRDLGKASTAIEKMKRTWYRCSGGPNQCRRSKRLHSEDGEGTTPLLN